MRCLTPAGLGLVLWALGASASPILGRNITTITSADGVAEHVSGVDEAGTQVLAPGVHWNLNTTDLKHVVPVGPKTSSKMHYGVTNSSDIGYFATLDMHFKLPSINLDHTDHVKEEAVDASTFKMTFACAESFKIASDTWKTKTGNSTLLLITNTDGCDRQIDGDRCFFRADSLEKDESSKVITAKGASVHPIDVITTGSASWGWHEAPAPVDGTLQARGAGTTSINMADILSRLQKAKQAVQQNTDTVNHVLTDITAMGSTFASSAALSRAQADLQKLQQAAKQVMQDFEQLTQQVSGSADTFQSVDTKVKSLFGRRRAVPQELSRREVELEVRGLLDDIKAAADKVKNAVEGTAEKIKDGFKGDVDKAKADVAKVKDAAEKELKKHEARSIWDKIKGAADKAGDAVKGAADKVGDAVKGGADKVKDAAEAAKKKAEEEAKKLADDAKAAKDKAEQAAKDAANKVASKIMGGGTKTLTFDFPKQGKSKIAPGNSPFGPNAIKIANLHATKRTGTSQHAMTGTSLSGDVDVYCVDCSISGSVTMSGSLHFGDGKAVSGGLDVKSDMHMSIKAGFDAQGVDLQKDFYTALFDLGVPGLSFGPVEIGPFIEVGMHTVLDVAATGTLLVGADVDLKGGEVSLDLSDPTKSKKTSWDTKVTPTVNATGEVQLSAQFGIPVSLNFGIKIAKFDETVKLVNEPSIKGVGQVAGTIGKGDDGKFKDAIKTNSNGCKGIETSLSWKDDLKVVAFNHPVASIFSTGDKPILDKCIAIPGQPKDAESASASPSAHPSGSPSASASASAKKDAAPTGPAPKDIAASASAKGAAPPASKAAAPASASQSANAAKAAAPPASASASAPTKVAASASLRGAAISASALLPKDAAPLASKNAAPSGPASVLASGPKDAAPPAPTGTDAAKDGQDGQDGQGDDDDNDTPDEDGDKDNDNNTEQKPQPPADTAKAAQPTPAPAPAPASAPAPAPTGQQPSQDAGNKPPADANQGPSELEKQQLAKMKQQQDDIIKQQQVTEKQQMDQQKQQLDAMIKEQQQQQGGK